METAIPLSEAQGAAITAPTDCPLMILAAAGSGKTLVLCHRIMHLISQGIPPKEILAVTFTRRAGQDLHSRLKSLGAERNSSIDGVRVATFHSFCLSILRAFPSQAGLAPNFIIFTPKMQLELIEELVKEWYTERNAQKRQENVIKGLFKTEAYRLMKQLGQLERQDQKEALESTSSASFESGLFKWVSNRYLLHLRKANAIDFSNFVRHTNNLFENYPGALDALGMKFQHILGELLQDAIGVFTYCDGLTNFLLVDEFQDTDIGQFKLLLALCKRRQHLTIVGDDDQQIYSWRGAAGIRNFTRFLTAFNGAKVVKLEQNFRSTGAIVAAARSVIGRNKHRMQKAIRTWASTGELLTICECRNELCEAVGVSNFILSLKAKGVDLHEIVVLYRLHRVGLELQHSLQARGVPCEIKSGYGTGDDGISSETAKGVRRTGEAFADIMSVFRLILNESDDYACKRLVKLLCPAHLEIFACITHLQDRSRMSLLQALKAIRSHLLGMAACGDLSSFKLVQSLLSDSKKVQEVTDGMHIVLRVIAATKDELQKLSMKDVIRNLLQEIAPYREEARMASFEISQNFDSRKPVKNPSASSDFAGIKALLEEAASFDTDNCTIADRSIGRSQSGTKQIGYKDMRKQQRKEPGAPSTRINYMERLRQFLDQVAIKSHDYELGESNEPPHASSQKLTDRPHVVMLSTIHQAKGLEWTSVILVRANEGVIPVMDCDMVAGNHQEASIQQEEGLEEERRLMYVALTRAKSSVFITHLMTGGGQQTFPCRFLADIPRGLIHKTACYDSTPKNCFSEPNSETTKTQPSKLQTRRRQQQSHADSRSKRSKKLALSSSDSDVNAP